MFAVCVALYMAPSNISLRIFTDNQNVIFGANKGGNSDAPYEMVKWMHRVSASKQISVDLRWVRTEDN